MLPGGGYYNDNTGQGSASYVAGSNASVTAIDPAFHPTAGAPMKIQPKESKIQPKESKAQ